MLTGLILLTRLYVSVRLAQLWFLYCSSCCDFSDTTTRVCTHMRDGIKKIINRECSITKFLRLRENNGDKIDFMGFFYRRTRKIADWIYNDVRNIITSVRYIIRVYAISCVYKGNVCL